MNKRINACQLDFTYPPVFHSAERSSLDLTFDRRSDYKTIFSEDELENLGIVGRQAQNNANILQSAEAQRQPSCLLDKPLPPSRFSEAKASGDRGRICAPVPTNLLDFLVLSTACAAHLPGTVPIRIRGARCQATGPIRIWIIAFEFGKARCAWSRCALGS